jgi:NADH dehydrogenase
MSAMGASEDSLSQYGRTKAAGEKAVRGAGLDATVFRPSIIFGPGDGFVSAARGVDSRQPGLHPGHRAGDDRVHAGLGLRRRARFFRIAGQAPNGGRVFEVGGPETLTLNAIDREIAAAIGKPRKPLVHFPLWWGRFLAGRFEWLGPQGNPRVAAR